ncbi:MAG: cyclase family protein, partial [Deltaproteobacteria bacterium]
MANIIDISVSLRSDMPIWPGSIGLRLTRIMRLKVGNTANVSRLDCDVHVGTHVDAPWHFLDNGATVEQLPLD